MSAGDTDPNPDADGVLADEPFDCPGCPGTTEAWPRTVASDEAGDYWHPLCLLAAHPQIEKRDPAKECPDCGAPSPYRPLTYGEETRVCWVCWERFPTDAPKRDDVEVLPVEDWKDE
jgi:hypothetical protein